VLTVFVGGNHESSGFMSELPYGGWVAPNIFYMGFACVVEFAGLRIAGLSGIYKDRDYNKGHFERPPYQHGAQVSAYHVRSIDVFRLKQLKAREEPSDGNIIDVMITHDWPVGITDPEYGNLNWLLKIKSFFREDIEKNQLGNKYTMDILKQLRPRYWFAAHMHVKYPAVVPHADSEGNKTAEDTHFMALDKPTPNPKRQFLDVRHKKAKTYNSFKVFHIPISEDAEMELKYDPVWLAILRNTNGLVNVTPKVRHSILPLQAFSYCRQRIYPPNTMRPLNDMIFDQPRRKLRKCERFSPTTSQYLGISGKQHLLTKRIIRGICRNPSTTEILKAQSLRKNWALPT
jgi:lariat debranching enzyme